MYYQIIIITVRKEKRRNKTIENWEDGYRTVVLVSFRGK